MKKILLVLLSFILLTGFSKSEEVKEKEKEEEVVTATCEVFELDSFLEELDIDFEEIDIEAFEDILLEIIEGKYVYYTLSTETINYENLDGEMVETNTVNSTYRGEECELAAVHTATGADNYEFARMQLYSEELIPPYDIFAYDEFNGKFKDENTLEEFYGDEFTEQTIDSHNRHISGMMSGKRLIYNNTWPHLELADKTIIGDCDEGSCLITIELAPENEWYGYYGMITISYSEDYLEITYELEDEDSSFLKLIIPSKDDEITKEYEKLIEDYKKYLKDK